jgi:predicted dehydrogenase
VSAAPLRVGVAGLGFGRAVHGPALAALPGVSVAAVLGRDPARAYAAAAELGGARACTGLDDFLGQGLDAVSLALPPAVQETVLEKVIAARIAVLCEKPPALTAACAGRLAGMAAGLPTAVDFQFRELPAFRAAKDLIDSGTIGGVAQAEIAWHVESYAQREKRWSWKTDRTLGGGVLTLLGTHVLYLVEWLLSRVEGGAGKPNFGLHARLFADPIRPGGTGAAVAARPGDSRGRQAGAVCGVGRTLLGRGAGGRRVGVQPVARRRRPGPGADRGGPSGRRRGRADRDPMTRCPGPSA